MQKPSTTAEYARLCATISEAFSERFQDMKCKQMELDIFAAPFNVTAAVVPSNFLRKIIELQADNTLKDIYLDTPLIDFYQRYINADVFSFCETDFKFVPLLGSTYCCEQFFFFRPNITKSRFRFGLTNKNVEMELGVAASLTSAGIARLAKEKF